MAIIDDEEDTYDDEYEDTYDDEVRSGPYMEASQTKSLKRIADALEKLVAVMTAPPMLKVDPTTPLPYPNLPPGSIYPVGRPYQPPDGYYPGSPLNPPFFVTAKTEEGDAKVDPRTQNQYGTVA